jgi:hypothetical protein
MSVRWGVAPKRIFGAITCGDDAGAVWKRNRERASATGEGDPRFRERLLPRSGCQPRR